ncbi:MAG: hypothetical protein H7Z38_13300, partial [Rubrivivax sp.]|nr:hypothetical protein [Pyrinomonadaceae bacterium]
MPKTSNDKDLRRTSVRPLALLCALLLAAPFTASASPARKNHARPAAQKGKAVARPSVPAEILLQIIEAEDARRWDESDLGIRLRDATAAVRRRAALAA